MVTSAYTYKAFISYSHRSALDVAAALQSGLHRLAKPVFAIRAFKVFRDKTSMSANPGVWPTIVKALEQSEYFLLMASPEAAASEWVKKEVGWWLDHHRTHQFLVAVTSGEIKWDERTGDFDWSATTCLPDELKGRFDAEPKWVDFRWARDDTDLSLNHSLFRAAVLDFAAPLHGKPKEDLDGDDIRRQRRLRRLTWATGCVLIALTAFAISQERIARRQEQIAQEQAKIAQQQRAEAVRQAKLTASQLAKNWYKLSQDVSAQSALAAFVYAAQAAEAAPDDDDQLGTYLDRIINLAERLPNDVVNLPLNEGIQAATFNASLTKVAVVTDDGKIRVFELPSGKPLFVPDHVNAAGHAGAPPRFGHDGVRISTYHRWSHPEPDPDESGQYALLVEWNPVDRTIYTPVDDGNISPDELKWTVLGGASGQKVLETPDPAAVFRSIPHLKNKIPHSKGAAKQDPKVMTVSADGSVFTWSIRESSAMSQMFALAPKSRWQTAVFSTDTLIAIDDAYMLGAWNVPSGARSWSSKLRENARLRVSPTGAAILADFSDYGSNGAYGIWASYELTSGRQLKQERLENPPGDALLATALSAAGNVVSAWSFYTGGKDDDLVFAGAESQERDSKCERFDASPRGFLDLLPSAQHFLVGSAGTFQIRSLCGGTAVASFYFGDASSLSPVLARSLIDRVVEVDVSDPKTVRLRLTDGPHLLAARAPNVTTALILPTGRTIVTPHGHKSVERDHVALSVDGKWMAVATKQGLGVWDAHTGLALSSTSLPDEPLDVQFAKDGRSVRVALRNGKVLVHALGFHWTGKPVWLTELAKAVTGRSVEPEGTIVRVSPNDLPAIQNRVLAQLQKFADTDSAAGYLHRLFGQPSGRDRTSAASGPASEARPVRGDLSSR